jgi:hypothetical protein
LPGGVIGVSRPDAGQGHSPHCLVQAVHDVDTAASAHPNVQFGLPRVGIDCGVLRDREDHAD